MMADRYTAADVLGYAAEEDVKFIRLAFLAPSGRQKNISIMPGELKRAFEQGIPIDTGAAGFDVPEGLLRPDPGTLSVLPWRPEHGRVVRMFCTLHMPDGGPLPGDSRGLLIRAADQASDLGITIGQRLEFYLFKAEGQEPLDRAGAMDIAPEDRGENTRRTVCLHLEEMGIRTLKSYHLAGPGQNTVELAEEGPLDGADHCLAAATAIRAAAEMGGLRAELSADPLDGHPGNQMELSLGWKGFDEGSAAVVRDTVRGICPGSLTEVKGDRLRILLRRPARDPYLVYGALVCGIMEGVSGKGSTPGELWALMKKRTGGCP